MIRFAAVLFSLLIYSTGIAKAFEIQKIEPTHWWIGMKDPSLQLMVHGKGADKCTVDLPNAGDNWKLIQTRKTANPDYLFVDLEISASASPGVYLIDFQYGKEKKVIKYELKARNSMASGASGYGKQDVLYLIMPDRFANGDLTNDFPPGSLEKPDRTKPFGRHGGDLAGIEKHLDYIQNLGVTTLWLNPILENNQPEQSYHGYSITDYYKIDSRFGGLDDYKRLIQKCHNSGLKMVQDMVANHIGSKHVWMESLPDTDWVHFAGKPYTRCNFRIETIVDPNSAKNDLKLMTDGWFDKHMPDINQKNPLLAKYLIQNTLWWIAETGIDGIRMDTWPYNDKDFISRWCDAVYKEFPQFSIVGEVWVDQPSFAAYFTQGALNQDGYKPSLGSVTDFPFYLALTKGLNEKGGWETGLQKIYTALSQDFLYKDASRNLIFPDNHDLSRLITTQGGDFRKYMQAMGIILTMRGIPQIYYGDEFALDGDAAQHPNVRLDFKGGWPDDKENYFDEKSLTGRADSAFKFLKKLLGWRKSSKSISEGRFVQYLPEDNVYVYFRIAANEKVMVLVNGNDKIGSVDLSQFAEISSSDGPARNVLTSELEKSSGTIRKVDPHGIQILEWKK